MSKYSKQAMRRIGQLTWHRTLLRNGRSAEADAWAKKHRLHIAPPNYPELCIITDHAPKAAAPTGSTVNAVTVDNAAPKAAIAAALSEGAALAVPRSALSATAAYSGGAGVDRSSLANNLDQSAHRGQNLQSLSQGVSGGKAGQGASSTLGIAADAALLASPSGEVEGNKQSCQADKGGLFSNRLENGGWLVSGEGVVGGNCRNKWFVEVSVDGKWAKAAIGDVLVRRGTRVRVRLEWVSADGRDAEYCIVEALPEVEEPRQAAPVGLAQNDLKAKETAQEAKPETAYRTVAPQSLGLHQTGVQTIHDQPKEVVFQTTTMEKLVEAEKVGTAHVSGLSGPLPKHEDYRSPVLDDVPAQAVEQPTPPGVEGLGADDFMAQARREAIKALLGG